MSYRMDKEVFYSKLQAAGFRSLLEFARRTGIHRNTLSEYLAGREVFQNAFARIAAELGCDPLDVACRVMDAEVAIKDLAEIKSIIDHLVAADPKIAVVLLGSRAKGKSRKFSDWDLGITRIPDLIDGDLYLKLRGEIEYLADDLQRGVDLINIDAAPLWFFEGIDYDPIFLDGNREGFAHLMGVIHGIRKGKAA